MSAPTTLTLNAIVANNDNGSTPFILLTGDPASNCENCVTAQIDATNALAGTDLSGFPVGTAVTITVAVG